MVSNKTISRFFGIACLFSGFIAGAQETGKMEYEKIHWDSTANYADTIKAEEEKYSAVYLQKDKIIELKIENDFPWIYSTNYQKVIVNDDRGIDYFNKEYLPASNYIEIVDIKARTITPSGKIVEFNKDNIKKIDNLDNKGAYNLFAIDGVEKGSIVEMTHTLKIPFSNNGNYVLQKTFPIHEGKFSLICPENLIFNFNISNYDKTVIDTVLNKKRNYLFEFKNMKPMQDEKYAASDANKAKIEYIFSHNKANGISSIYSWEKAAQNIYKQMFFEDKKGYKKVSKILKSLKIQTLATEEKIKAIENYIKEEIEIYELRGLQLSSELSNILDSKKTSKSGMVRLHVAFLSQAEIDFKLGVTSDRFETKFNEDFFTWDYITDYVIYYPGVDKYSAPTSTTLRLGTIPVGFCNNKAMFLNIVKLGDFESALHEIKEIPHNKMEENFTKQSIKVGFSDDLTSALVDYRYELGGYEAIYIKPYYELLPEDKKEEITDNYLKIMGDDTEVKERKVENTSRSVSCLDEPFIISGKLEIKSLIETAGRNIIFNVGDVIGEQVEMYDEHERENPIELHHVHYYDRIIEVDIPDGYSVKNLESLNINHDFVENGEKLMGFTTEYEITDNKVVIKIIEYYNKLKMPVEKYEDFRTVINAAADFNKASLIFEKK